MHLEHPRLAVSILLGLFAILGACESNDSTNAPPSANPVITSVAPPMLTEGTVATVTGTGFGSSGELLVNGTVVASTAYSDTTILFTVPAGLTGTQLDISVRTGGVTSAVHVAPFTEPASGPAITSTDPANLLAGAIVHLYGTGFGTSGELLINGDPVATSLWTDTLIQFTVPGNLYGTQLVLVVRTGGQDSAPYPVPYTEPLERQLTTGGTNANWVSWGNNGFIYFHAPTPAWDQAIWKVSVDGGDPILVYDGPGNDYFPDVNWQGSSTLWSSDDTSHGNVDGNWEIWRTYATFSSLNVVDPGTVAENPNNERHPVWNQNMQLGVQFAWSEDGLDGRSEIYIMRQYTVEPLVSGFMPRFRASNGDRLAFTTRRGDGGHDINVIGLAVGSVDSTLYGGPEVGMSIDWSTTGHILYITSQQDIWMMDEDGTGHRPIVETTSQEAYPRWSPNGALVGFVRLVGGSFEIFTTRVP